MKRILKIVVLAWVIMLGSALHNKSSAQYNGDVSYQTFYDELSPYGHWIEYPGYGYVWNPNEGGNFRPYSSNGHWVWSDDYDWLWASDYDWGWAPFHYGRWFYDPVYGWLWVPGYEWSPAWVAWRSGGDYYGWAPLRPGISISINFSLGNYYAPDDYWCFAPRIYITARNIFSHCIDRRQNFTIIRNTTIINNYNYGNNGFRTGPGRYEAERYCGHIEPFRFRESFRPGRMEFRNNEVSIYRPRVQRDDGNRFTPRQFDHYNRGSQNDENRITRNDNGFKRNNDGIRRDDNENNRDNNMPRRELNNNTRFERRNNNEVRQPVNNENRDNNNIRRLERRNSNEQNNDNNRRSNDGRIFRPVERQYPNQGDNNNGNNDSRQFERRNNFEKNNETPFRQSKPEFRNENNDRTERQNFPQREQRTQQEQPRQFERRDNANRRQENNDGNNNNGKSKSRRRF